MSTKRFLGLKRHEISFLLKADSRSAEKEDIMMKRRRLFAVSSAVIATLPSSAFGQDLATDPQGSGVIVSAVQWLQGTLLGTVATVAAVIAVAAVGFLMLTGRMNWRYGTIVILGCFVLFGAASIVAGIQATASATAG